MSGQPLLIEIFCQDANIAPMHRFCLTRVRQCRFTDDQFSDYVLPLALCHSASSFSSHSDEFVSSYRVILICVLLILFSKIGSHQPALKTVQLENARVNSLNFTDQQYKKT